MLAGEAPASKLGWMGRPVQAAEELDAWGGPV